MDLRQPACYSCKQSHLLHQYPQTSENATITHNESTRGDDSQTLQPLKQTYQQPIHPLQQTPQRKHHRQLAAKFRVPPTIATIMVLQINYDTINLVEECQAYQSSLLLFLIPFAFLLGQTLSYFQLSSGKGLSIYPLFIKLIQNITAIKNSVNPQLPQHQINSSLTFLIRYNLHQPRQISEEFGTFLRKHHQKMLSFIPVYCSIFSFHAIQKYQFVESLQTQQDLHLRRTRLKAKLKEIEKSYKAYHNQEI